MPSIFSYYRPRGIRGNYIVAILLDLAGTETATVNVARQRGTNCGHCGVQTPRIEQHAVNPARTMIETGERRWELYRIDQMIVGDSITVQVQDRDVIPYQETQYIAFPDTNSTAVKHVSVSDGFIAQERSYSINGYVWAAEKTVLNPIQLIDWDKQDKYAYRYTPAQQTTAQQKPEMARVWQLLQEAPPTATNGHAFVAVQH